MSDLIKKLEAWADHVEGNGFHQRHRTTEDMLNLLRPVIVAAESIHSFKTEGAWDQSKWVEAQHALHDALADLPKKLGGK